MAAPAVDVILVAAAPGVASPAPAGSLLAPLVRALGPNKTGRERLVLLPPLYLHSVVAAARARRPLRAWGQSVGRTALVWVAHPRASWRELPLLAAHSPTYAAFREEAGGLSEALGATVVAGTVILAQPRKHWERWPDEPLVFHHVWALGPHGQPAGHLWDPAPPSALRRRGVRPGWPESSPTRPPTSLPEGRPRVHVAWPQGGPATASDPSIVTVWKPLAEGRVGDADPVRGLRAQPRHVAIYAVADAQGGATWAVRGSGTGPTRRGALQATQRRPLVWDVLSVDQGRAGIGAS